MSIRALRTDIHFLYHVSMHALFMMLVSFIPSLHLLHNLKEHTVWMPVVVLWASSTAASFCQNRAAQTIDASITGVLRTLDIPLGFAVAWLILREWVENQRQLAACALIMTSSLVMAYKGLRANT